MQAQAAESSGYAGPLRCFLASIELRNFGHSGWGRAPSRSHCDSARTSILLPEPEPPSYFQPKVVPDGKECTARAMSQFVNRNPPRLCSSFI
jgi:hypothetical protein